MREKIKGATGLSVNKNIKTHNKLKTKIELNLNVTQRENKHNDGFISRVHTQITICSVA